MRKVRPTPLPRLLALLALVLALVTGAAACSGDSSPEAAPETTVEATTSTSVAPAQGAVIATAKVPDLVVFAEPPAELRAASTTTTTAPPGAHLPIPRVGLNSAGVAKVPLGYQFDNPTYFDNPLVLQVVEEHGDWLKVLIQARPNHTEGWVKAADVELSTTDYRMVLSLEDRHLVVYDGEAVVAETDVAIGKKATPTPVGTFFLSEKIQQQNPGGSYGPWILSTNGYSEALDLFDNGLPVVAFHGTNQPALIGTEASNGCIRMPNDVVTQLAEMLPAGTPIEIVAGPMPSTAPSGVPGTATTVAPAA